MAKSTMVAAVRPTLSGAFVVSLAALLAGCAGNHKFAGLSGVEPVERVVGPNDPVTPGGGRYQVGKAYSVGGRTYVPREDPNYDSVGFASWYGGEYHHGTRTANGEVYDRTTISAAHPTMPLPSYARVTNLRTGRSLVVRVNDRGPYAADRLIDMSEKTAELLDMKRTGVDKVRVQYIGRAGLGGSDTRVLAATLRGPGIAPAGEERTLLAQADLPIGPRRTPTPMAAPVMVADAGTMPIPSRASLAPAPMHTAALAVSLPVRAGAIAAPAPVRTASFAPPAPVQRPGLAPNVRAYTAMPDAFSLDLAGVDAKALRAAMKPSTPHPVSSSAEAVAAEMPGASGAPLSIMPIGEKVSAAPVAPSGRTSFAEESRVAAAHAVFSGLGEGETLGKLAD